MARERSVLGRPPEPGRERNLRSEGLTRRLRQKREHGSVKRSGRDGAYADPERREIARNWQREPHHTTLGGRVRRLPDLPVERRDRRGIDNHAALALAVGRILRHL